jgi:hypothetical protein
VSEILAERPSKDKILADLVSYGLRCEKINEQDDHLADVVIKYWPLGPDNLTQLYYECADEISPEEARDLASLCDIRGKASPGLEYMSVYMDLSSRFLSLIV